MLGGAAGSAGNMMWMVEKLSNSGIVEKAQKAMSIWSHCTNFITDIVLYIFGNFLMDSILVMAYKWGMVASKDKSMPTLEGFDMAEL